MTMQAPSKKITIMITDDHTLLRQSLSMMLNSEPEFRVVAECGSGEEAVELARDNRPDVVLMDYNLPGMNGIEATQLIRKFSPGSKVVGVSLHSHPAYARKMMQSGAMGYLTKNSSHDEMVTAITEVHNNRKYVCNEIKNALSEQMIGGQESTRSTLHLADIFRLADAAGLLRDPDLAAVRMSGLMALHGVS